MRRARLIVAGILAVGVVCTGSTPAFAGAGGAVHHPHPRSEFLVWTQDYQDGTGSNHLVIADARGGHERVLTHPGPGVQDIDPSISPDGRTVVFERDADGHASTAEVVSISGRGERTLPLPCADPCAGIGHPVWAPDGRHVVFSRVIGPFDQVNTSARSAVLWRAALDGSHLTRLSQRGIDGAYEDYDASFAPAGYLVFDRIRNADIRNAVFRMDADGSHVRQLTPWSLSADLPYVSPARRGPTKDLVVFETYGQGPPDGASAAVATVPATCRSLTDCASRIRALTPTTPRSPTDYTASFNPSWSPDGRSIAYVAFEYVQGAAIASGSIWTMRFDGRHQRRLSKDSYFDYRPAWGRL